MSKNYPCLGVGFQWITSYGLKISVKCVWRYYWRCQTVRGLIMITDQQEDKNGNEIKIISPGARQWQAQPGYKLIKLCLPLVRDSTPSVWLVHPRPMTGHWVLIGWWKWQFRQLSYNLEIERHSRLTSLNQNQKNLLLNNQSIFVQSWGPPLSS